MSNRGQLKDSSLMKLMTKRRSSIAGRIFLTLGYYAFTLLLIMFTSMAGHGISSPATVFWSWAALGIRLTHKGIAPFVLYFGLILGVSILTYFSARLEGRFNSLIPSGVYLSGSICASLALRGFEREPLLPYLALFFLSVLLVIAYLAIDWRLERTRIRRSGNI